MQLQGQTGDRSRLQYKNTVDAIHKIYVNEGMKGLQKGIYPAILRESSKNVFRIGMFDPIMNVIHDKKTGSAPAWKRMFAGSMCGVLGAVSCNPFELVKTRLQSASTGILAVGHQHNYTGVGSALKLIYNSEGFRGLYRGSLLSMGRSVVGSGSNLTAYSLMKEYMLTDLKWKDGISIDLISGLGSGLVSCIFMNPVDVVRTRYYNQKYVNGVGELYTSGLDCSKKVLKHEGLRGFYKGFVTHFLRIGPHFCRIFF